jgi:hypothetical protein
MPIPGKALLEVLVLTAWAAKAAQWGELASQVVRQPAPDACAELLVLGGQLHGRLRRTVVSGARSSQVHGRLSCTASPAPGSVRSGSGAHLRRLASVAWDK